MKDGLGWSKVTEGSAAWVCLQLPLPEALLASTGQGLAPTEGPGEHVSSCLVIEWFQSRKIPMSLSTSFLHSSVFPQHRLQHTDCRTSLEAWLRLVC